MAGDELCRGIHHRHKPVVPVHAAHVRLPPLPHRCQHQAGYDRTRGRTPNRVRDNLHNEEERRHKGVHRRQLPRLYMAVCRRPNRRNQAGIRAADTRLHHRLCHNRRRHNRLHTLPPRLHIPARSPVVGPSRRQQLWRYRPDIRVCTGAWRRLLLSYGFHRQGHSTLARHNGCRIPLLPVRRDNAQDHNTLQPRTAAAKERHHHRQVEPQPPAADRRA